MSLVQGKNVVVYIFDDMVLKPYLCATDCSLNVVTESIETSVSGNGLFASYLPTKNSFTGSIGGLVSLNEDGFLTIADLRGKQIVQEIFVMQFERTAEDGTIYTSQASFFITNSQDGANFNGVNSFNITLQGTGAITEDVQPPLPPVTTGYIQKQFLGFILTETGDFILTET